MNSKISLIAFIGVFSFASAMPSATGDCDCYEKHPSTTEQFDKKIADINTCLDTFGTYEHVPIPSADEYPASLKNETKYFIDHLKNISFPEEKNNELYCCGAKAMGLVTAENEISVEGLTTKIRDVFVVPEVQEILIGAIEECKAGVADYCDLKTLHICIKKKCEEERCPKPTPE